MWEKVLVNPIVKNAHNYIFTKVVLHQIDRLVFQMCNVCGVIDENLIQTMCECVVLKEFKVKLSGTHYHR